MIKVVQWDLGDADERGCVSDGQWEMAMRVLQRISADAVLLSGWKLAETGMIEVQGLEGALAVPAGEDGEESVRTIVGAAVNPEVFRVRETRTRSRAWFDNPVHLRLELNAAPLAGELHLVTFSMCPFAADRRRAEAGWLAGLTRDGVTLAGGATRSYPAHSTPKAPHPDLSTIGDAVQRVHRTFPTGLGWEVDTVPDTILAGGDPAAYVDLARYAARHCGLPDAEDPTVLADAVRDAGQRVHRQYGSGGLASTVHSLILLPKSQTSHVSPHRVIVTQIRLDRLVSLLSQQPAQEA